MASATIVAAAAPGITPGAAGPATNAIDWDVLVRDFRAQLVRTAQRRLGNWHDAEDATQDALIRAWADRDSFVNRDGKPPIAWVATIAKFTAMHVLRDRARYVAAGDWVETFAAEQEARPTDTGLPCSADPETCSAAYLALAKLPDRQRLVVQMWCMQGMDRRDVARHLGLPMTEVIKLGRLGIRALTRRNAPEVAPAGRPKVMYRDDEVVALFSDNRDLVAKLAPRQREAVELCIFEGMSQTGAAKRMGVESSAVKRYLLVATERVRGLVEGRPVRSRMPDRPDLDALVADEAFLASLPELCRSVTRLRLVDRASGPKVAEELGIKESQVWSIQRRVVDLWSEWTPAVTA